MKKVCAVCYHELIDEKACVICGDYEPIELTNEEYDQVKQLAQEYWTVDEMIQTIGKQIDKLEKQLKQASKKRDELMNKLDELLGLI